MAFTKIAILLLGCLLFRALTAALARSILLLCYFFLEHLQCLGLVWQHALAIREQLERRHLALMAYEVINRKLAAHIGKYDGIFARLCLLWHCVEGGGSTINERTAQRVASFMRGYLLPHAAAFYAGMLALSDDHDRLTNVAGYILAKKLTRITNRDVQRGDRAMRGLERQEIEGIFDQLEALGWLIRMPNPRWSSPPHWQVNPEAHHRFAARAAREATDRAKEREMVQEMFRGGGGQ